MEPSNIPLTYELIAYFLPLTLIWLNSARSRLRLERFHSLGKARAHEEGLTEPASLHPLIDASTCIGCRSCLNACPEQDEHHVLGFISGKAELIAASNCIGHGACKTACPVDAISLVFGTSARGVDLPHVEANFETNVPGVFISGELGGMGLIRNAIEQGRQAVEGIARRERTSADPTLLDVMIVGAGPAGFSASLSALEHKLRFVTVEQDSLGGAIRHYPRGKLTMMHSAKLPFFGKLKLVEASKERLLSVLEEIERRSRLRIHYQERMQHVAKSGDAFVVTTDRGIYRARNVLLALGRRGTPNRLGAPGEDLPKVVYRLVDPEQYRGQNVLVVGGGDSAVEAAVSLAANDGGRVAIAHRAEGFARAKSSNRRRLQELCSAGRVRVLSRAEVKEIGPAHVVVEQCGQRLRFDNDAVIVCAGGALPTPLLMEIGVRFETKYGTA